MRESPRIRRLRNDRKSMQQLRSESSIIDFDVSGDLADKYHIRFYGKGLYRENGQGDVLLRNVHEVRIVLGASYPRMMPEISWVTPIFHPNISASGVVCLGGYGTHWVPSLSLDELCSMLWDMIRYQNFDVDSPYNREAALWARTQTTFVLPVDDRPIRDRVAKLPSSEQGSSTAERRFAPPAADARTEQPQMPEVVIIDDADEEIVDAEIVSSEDQDIVFLD